MTTFTDELPTMPGRRRSCSRQRPPRPGAYRHHPAHELHAADPHALGSTAAGRRIGRPGAAAQARSRAAPTHRAHRRAGAVGRAEHQSPVTQRVRQHVLLGGRALDARLVPTCSSSPSTPAERSPSTNPPPGLWVQGLSAASCSVSILLSGRCCPGDRGCARRRGSAGRSVTPRFGPAAGVMSALALAVFPSFVAVSRDNNLDAVLILLLILACGVGARDRLGQAADAPWLRRARRARIQHQDPRRLSRRPRARARLHRLCAGIARAPRCSAARRGHRTGARIGLVVARRRTHPRLAAPVRGRLDR